MERGGAEMMCVSPKVTPFDHLVKLRIAFRTCVRERSPMADLSNVRVDGARLWDSLMEMAKIGAPPKGGCKRLTLTDLDKQSRELFRAWCEAAGWSVEVDDMGNMFARRPGEDDTLAPVMMGSHLDTQPTGGKFDGALGVLGALEVVRSLNDLNIRTKRPIEVANWTNEEASRYAPAMISSGVFAGVFTKDFAYSRLDADGKTLGDELERIGFKGEEPVGARPVHAFFELHIEQGPILWRTSRSTSGSSRTDRVSAGTRSAARRDLRATPARRRCRAAGTRCWARRGSWSSSTRSAYRRRRSASRPWACSILTRIPATLSLAKSS